MIEATDAVSEELPVSQCFNTVDNVRNCDIILHILFTLIRGTVPQEDEEYESAEKV